MIKSAGRTNERVKTMLVIDFIAVSLVVLVTISIFYGCMAAAYGADETNEWIKKFYCKMVKPFNKLKNWIKVKKCRANNHKFGALILIERTPVGNWEPERAGRTIRIVNDKYICENCRTIFIRNNEWQGKSVN